MPEGAPRATNTRRQQPHGCRVLQATFADACREIELGILIGTAAAKSDADSSPSRHRSRDGSRGVLPVGKFALPFSVAASVAADKVKELGAAERCAVAQYHRAVGATIDAVPRL